MRLKAMVKEIPRHYWSNMPETSLMPAMVAEADQHVARLIARPTRRRFSPSGSSRAARPSVVAKDVSLDELRPEVSACRRCSLHSSATQAVFGDGPRDAALMFVGEQPGDQEVLGGPAVHRTGRPSARPRACRGEKKHPGKSRMRAFLKPERALFWSREMMGSAPERTAYMAGAFDSLLVFANDEQGRSCVLSLPTMCIGR
jgi:hypothetical protein